MGNSRNNASAKGNKNDGLVDGKVKPSQERNIGLCVVILSIFLHPQLVLFGVALAGVACDEMGYRDRNQNENEKGKGKE